MAGRPAADADVSDVSVIGGEATALPRDRVRATPSPARHASAGRGRRPAGSGHHLVRSSRRRLTPHEPGPSGSRRNEDQSRPRWDGGSGGSFGSGGSGGG
ncbi:hypothetical protein ACFY3J_05860 [Streptomyces sp. NPDC001231]|uniref:hypothetical protein n=1 Tax=Streptomyces sp. NPDC001231 TaxID=3364549 RepID=UPI0036AA0928